MEEHVDLPILYHAAQRKEVAAQVSKFMTATEASYLDSR